MSDQIAQSDYGGDGRSGPSYHSVWMAHWMRTNCNTAPPFRSCSFENTENTSNAKQPHLVIGGQAEVDVPRTAKVVETTASEIMNENSKNGILGSQPFPSLYPCRNSGSTSVANIGQDNSHLETLRLQNTQRFEDATAPHASNSHFSSVREEATPATEPSLRAGHFKHEISFRNHSEPRKPLILQDTCFTDTQSAYHTVPYQVNYGEDRRESRKNGPSSFICTEEVNQLRSVLPSEECLPNASLTRLERGQSALFVCEKKMDGRSDCVSAVQNLRQGNIRRLVHDPSVSNNQSSAFGGEEYQKMQNHSGIVMSPIENSSVNIMKPEKLAHGCYSLTRMPDSVEDVETMRICTTVDSVEGLPGCPSRYSQTTHSLLITKKAAVNLCKEKQIFRESATCTLFEGNRMGELQGLGPLVGHGSRVKLQQLSSSNDSEGKENIDLVNASDGVLKNESSAETDTMDIDAFKEKNFLSGEYCSPSDKDAKSEPNLPHRVKSKQPAIELPDMNLEPPTLPATASSMEHPDPSTSRTQSLDMELLLSHADRLGDAESIDHRDGSLGLEPTSRWLKRLKSSASDSFAVGTKSLNLDQASSHGKVNKFLDKIMKKDITSSEPTFGKCRATELLALDQVFSLTNKDCYSSVGTAKQGKPITLSHAWIQRWRPSGAASNEKKVKNVVVHEPQTSKLAMDDFRKKEFPSVAAMALMSKVMRGFQPCKFRKEGSFVVWNTRSL